MAFWPPTPVFQPFACAQLSLVENSNGSWSRQLQVYPRKRQYVLVPKQKKQIYHGYRRPRQENAHLEGRLVHIHTPVSQLSNTSLHSLRVVLYSVS